MEYRDYLWVILFIIGYFAVIWSVLIKLAIVNLREIPWKKRKPPWKWIFIAFFLLASGDIVHLGLRINLYLSGHDQTGQYANFIFGLGYIASGITMTYFYIAILHALINIYGPQQSLSYNKKFLIVAYAAFILRIFMVALPYNHWFDGIGVDVSAKDFGFDFRIITGIPIFIVGINTLVYLFKVVKKEIAAPSGIDSDVNKGILRASRWYIVSYACYGIALLFIAVYPVVGFFYAPKTIAYLMALYHHYKTLLNRNIY